MTVIDLKTNPDIKRVVQAAFPGYKRHKAWVSVFSQEHGKNINSYWDGGSRAEFAVVEIANYRTRSLPTATHPYFDVAKKFMKNQSDRVVEVDNVGNIRMKVLPEGFALVQAGTFCGKAAHAHVFFNAANMPKLLA